HFGIGVTKLLARPITLRTFLEHARRQLRSRRQHSTKVFAGFRNVALRYGSTLRLVGSEQTSSSPSFNHRSELPPEVNGVLHACIHPECAGRRIEMGCITGDVDPAAPVAIGDELAPYPRNNRQHFEFERFSHRPLDIRSYICLIQGALVLISDDGE